MKKYINGIALLFINLIIAQNPPVLTTTALNNSDDQFKHANKGNYAIDVGNERDQYLGVWEYNQNGVLFQLKIEKKDQNLLKMEESGQIIYYVYTDIVTLKYKLVVNNVVKHNNLFVNSVNTSTAYGTKRGGSNLLTGRLFDFTRNAVGSYTIEKINGSPEKINFDLSRFNYTLKNPHSYYEDGAPLFSIPMGGIEMIKVQ